MSVESQKTALTDEVRREMASFVATGSEPGVFHDWLIDRGIVDDLYDAVCLYAPHPHLGLLGQDEIDWQAVALDIVTNPAWTDELGTIDPERLGVCFKQMGADGVSPILPMSPEDWREIGDRHRRRREVMDPWLGGAVLAQFLDDFGHASAAVEVLAWGKRRVVPRLDLGEQQAHESSGIRFVLWEEADRWLCPFCGSLVQKVTQDRQWDDVVRCRCHYAYNVVDRDNPATWPPVRYAVLATSFFEKLRWHIEYRVSQVEMETTRDLLGFIQDARRRAAFLPAWRHEAGIVRSHDPKHRCFVMRQELRPLDMLPPPPRASNVIDVVTWENSDVSVAQNLREIYDGIIDGLEIPSRLAAPRGAGGDSHGT